MANTRGVFGLEYIREQKIPFDEWISLSDVWITTPTPNTGYFGGGYQNSTMDKVTYSSDTTAAVPGARLTVARSQLAATGSSTAGYFGGGTDNLTPNPYSTMDKVTYSSDTTAAVTGAALSVARSALAATSSLTSGYFGGGGSPQRSTVDKLTYSTDTTAAAPGAALSTNVIAYFAATGNSTAGYFGGGRVSSSYYSLIQKITYSTDTSSTIPARLTAARYSLAATSSLIAGYFGGGYASVAPVYRETMDKITYSNDTTAAAPGANLTVARYSLAATGSLSSGYFGGGGAASSYSTMDKVTYSTDTRTTVSGAALSAARNGLAASSARANILPETFPDTRFNDGLSASNTGYFGGGLGPGYYSTMDKVTYSSDTTAAVPGAALTVARGGLAATGSSTAGYFGGGGSPGTHSTMDKLTYSSDTTAAVTGAALSVARELLAATGSSIAGYFSGGFPAYSTMDKLTYSSDTTAAVPGAFLPAGRRRLAATGNSTVGYFGGGQPGAEIFKLTYSSDTTAQVPSASLTASRSYLAATGSSSAGYFGGGPGFYSTTDKLTYSTDTTAAVPGAALSAARQNLAATGSTTAGYFGGGLATGPSVVATMDKTTYSSDTTAAVPGANLSAARSVLAASSARANALPQPPLSTPSPQTFEGSTPNTGYFGGGNLPANTTMDKLTYSTDTTAALPSSANLTVASLALAATGSSIAGYFSGGYGSPFGPGRYSTTNKVTYSSDTTAAAPGANLTSDLHSLAATGSSTVGYFGCGAGAGTPGYYSSVNKLIYSTDITVSAPSATILTSALNSGRDSLAATGSSSAGYFGGGNFGSSTAFSTMNKLTYSTDTSEAVSGANLTVARGYLAATGSSTAGYFGGGIVSSNNYSTMDKLTYSTDTTAVLPSSGFLSVARYGVAATGNSTAGYFGGGSPGPRTTMDKVTYSTDTRTTVSGAALSVARESLAASSARANALSQPTYPVPVFV